MKNLFRSILFSVLTGVIFSTTAVAQQNGTIFGQVQDTLGAVVVGASVIVVAPGGGEKTTTSNQRGEFSVGGLAPGTYIVRVQAPNFALYENTEVQVTAGRQELTVPLTVAAVDEQVDVSSSTGVSTDPENNAGATVLKEKDLEALPDDPEELEAALQALAGASAGPNGGQIYIDGFTGGRLPPREAIREIRINQNPFSAEYERLGFGRIEVLTKPGVDKFRGQVFGNFNDESLNSRNPFAANRAPSQLRFFGGNVSGPLQKGKSSYFIDVNNRDVGNTTVINAIILDPALNPLEFRQDVQIPNRRFSLSPRFDYAINDKNTLIARYSFTRNTVDNQGVGNLSLPSRAYGTSNVEHEFRLTETMIINPTTVNETRFELGFDRREQNGDNSIPTINVSEAFSGGGSQIGSSFSDVTDWELQNYTTTALGKNSSHSVKFGGRLRGIRITDSSENNFGGAFTFAGAPEIRSPAGCTTGTPGCTVTPAVGPLEQYRQNILGNRTARFVPSQFSITTGNPEQSVSRTDVGLFITDDWRVSAELTLSFGLRYENQTNISDNSNFAPRASFAWSPGAGGAKPPKTVFRGGFGVFYDRFSENLTLQAERFNGSEQFNLIVSSTDPDPVRRADAIALLAQPIFTVNGVTNVPTAAQIRAVLPQSNTIRAVASDLKSPRTAQIALGMERQLPARTTMSLFYIGSRTWNFLRSRNINAPVCPDQINCVDAPRPIPGAGNIYQYESSGILNQNQFIANFRSTISPKISLFGNYRLGFAKGDSDGTGSFPAYSYDLSDEYGRSSFDIRHNFVMGGNINLPWQISVSPFIIASTGRPFNITLGSDLNRDALFTERPTFAQLGAACLARNITSSWCDVAGEDQNAIIPRNHGQGEGFFAVNMRIAKNFGFGGAAANAAAGQSGAGPGRVGGIPVEGGQGRGGRGGRGGGRAGGGGGRRGGFGGGAANAGEVRKPYNLNIGVNINNLFNTVNLAAPIGNIASSRFGQSTSTIGGFGGFGGGGFGGGGGGGAGSANRRIELQARFSW